MQPPADGLLLPLPGVTIHAREQLRDRHGLLPGLDGWLRAVADILDGRALLLRRNDDGSEVLLVTLCGVAVRVVWRPHSGTIVTVLPPYRRIDDWYKRERKRCGGRGREDEHAD